MNTFAKEVPHMDIQGTLISIWREAFRHIEIAESTAATAQVLAPPIKVRGQRRSASRHQSDAS